LANGQSIENLLEFKYNFQMDKNEKVRRSNWEKPSLTPYQIIYAAADAYYSREIFVALYLSRAGIEIPEFCVQHLQLYPRSKQRYESNNFTDTKRRMAWNDVTGWIAGLVDSKGMSKKSSTRPSLRPLRPARMPKTPAIGPRREATRKKPVYDNCTMVDPDGNFLCYCSKRKVEWYLEKN